LGEDKFYSKAVGDIAARLFSKEEDPSARTATGLFFQKFAAAEGSSDEDDGDDYQVEQYVVALPKVLQRSWAYALAVDSSAHIGGISYFCIRVHIPPLSVHDDIYSLHIVAPPMCGSHMGEYMFNITSEVLGALDPGWRTKLIGVTSDGAANMVGSVSGWQTRLRNDATDSESFYLMHCGTHQLNLVNGKAIAAIGHEGSDRLEKLHSVLKWLRKQANFIESLRSQSPYHIEVRWTSIDAVLAWWRKNQDEVTAHCLIEDKEIADDVEW
jgi:hypothetical protein